MGCAKVVSPSLGLKEQYMSEISSALYWSLPTPQEFSNKVTDAARSARALILSFPEFMPSNPIRAVERALKNASISEPLILDIMDGMNISVEIGTHFGGRNMPAQLLAHHVHGTQHAIVLQAHGKRAQVHCEKYTSEFVNSIDEVVVGDVRLVMAMRSGEYEADQSGGAIRVIAFDGGLSYAEMEAYVAIRMVSYPGPGSTSLFKHLVTEYASFDPVMAEKLSQMDQSNILTLPNSLGPIMSEDPVRWSRSSWVTGTKSTMSNDTHPLHEWYVASHSGSQSDKYRRLAERRYWKACLKAIIPWLEERRLRIISILDRPIKAVERAAGGAGKIEKKVGSQIVQVTRDELEYNDIVFQSRQSEFNRINLTLNELGAIGICCLAKTIRDELSHLRPPRAHDLASLISNMDRLIPS